MPFCDALGGAVVGREPEFGAISLRGFLTSPRIPVHVQLLHPPSAQQNGIVDYINSELKGKREKEIKQMIFNSLITAIEEQNVSITNEESKEESNTKQGKLFRFFC